MNDPSPAPAWTSTVSPEAAYFLTASGMRATRRSPGAVSFGTASVGRFPAVGVGVAVTGAGSLAAFGAFGALEALDSMVSQRLPMMQSANRGDAAQPTAVSVRQRK